MNYKAEIKVFGDAEQIYKSFLPELEKEKNNRANYRIRKEKDFVVFEIESKDSVSLRATLNSITKLFTVYEQVKEIK